jgi:hypothetical protein
MGVKSDGMLPEQNNLAYQEDQRRAAGTSAQQIAQ